ncbi:MAG: sterol desaturase family protein, partial [Fimbriimonas sp.]
MALPTILTELLRLALWLAALVVVFVPLEHWFAVQPHKPLRKQVLQDLGYYFLNSLLPAAILSVPAGLLGWICLRLLPSSYLDAVASLPFWAKTVLGLIAGETGYYWGHRW